MMRQRLRQLAQFFKARDVATSDEPRIDELKSWQDAATELAAKCEALKQLNERITQERDDARAQLNTRVEENGRLMQECDRLKQHNEILVPALQEQAREMERVQQQKADLRRQLDALTSDTGKATDADKAEQGSGEHDIGEPVSRVVPEAERPAKPTRGKRSKQFLKAEEQSAT